ncbi:MAG: hypothetical protein HRS50_02260, partial [Mycoplasmataceae bacterium]|nr:hypothetical protein [Mycoplasmataceae bacterium]
YKENINEINSDLSLEKEDKKLNISKLKENKKEEIIKIKELNNLMKSKLEYKLAKNNHKEIISDINSDYIKKVS